MRTPLDNEGDNKNKQSRLENRQSALKFNLMTQEEFDEFVRLPEIDLEFIHIKHWIEEIGFVLYGGMSAIPLSYQEIMAWAMLTENDPTPFEVQCLRDMSFAYLSMSELAKKPECKEPKVD